jgi:hypothetical protein
MASDAALYYPRIRIQDPNWLKMTLLCFGRVCRMIPLTYTAEDSDLVKECCETRGPHGPLVDSASLWAHDVQMALLRLGDNISAADEKAKYRFTREGYLHTGGDPALVDSFEIHKMKIEPLVQTLLDHQLAWKVTERRGEDWLAVHPDLGEVIMSTLAVAVADFDGLSIVTPSHGAHAITTSPAHQRALERLLGTLPRLAADPAGELLQVVMQSVVFDVSTLTIKKIAALLDRREDLISLRTVLEHIASRIPPMQNPETRAARVREAAVDAIHAWQKENDTPLAKLTTHVELADGVYEVGDAVLQLEFVKAAIRSVTFLFKLAKGQAEEEHEEGKRRYKFLNLVEHYGGPHTSSLFLPAFSKLA